MKKHLFISFSICCLASLIKAQTYLPIVTTGYNLDAVAENTTALATTGGVIDGSNYVLYSQAYGAIVGGATTGLPNNGLISSGTRTYQLQPYTANNMLYLPFAQSDTLYFTTPASYNSLSVLCFATEGTATMNLKVRFTDGTSQLFTSLIVDDWFSTVVPNPVITGIDRCTRPTGVPNYNSTNPRMFRIEINLTCANRLKQVQKLIVQNASSIVNPRVCVMGVSGGVSATYTSTTAPVTCAGGSNGSATIAIANGVPPFTYAWSTTPVQTTSVVNLPAGTTDYTITDASACTYTSSVNITQAIVPTLPMNIIASQNPVCSGSTVTLSTNGASTYTWSTNGSANSTTVSSTANTAYSVVATTTDNCTLYGNITVTINPLPSVTFTVVPQKICLNSPGIVLNASPANGSFSGQGISFGTFFPSLVGVGTQTLSYTFTDLNNCTTVETVTTTIASPTTVIAFAINPSTVCVMGSNITLTATPAGGTFSGSIGVTGSLFTPTMAVGTYTVMYSYTDANNCKETKVSSVGVRTCQYVGIQELSSVIRFITYPNPNGGSFIVESDSDADLQLINELGQTVLQLKLDATNAHAVKVGDLPAGIYFMSTSNRAYFQKIVVTK